MPWWQGPIYHGGMVCYLMLVRWICAVPKERSASSILPTLDLYDWWSLTSIGSALCISGLDKPLKSLSAIDHPVTVGERHLVLYEYYPKWLSIEWCYLSEVACTLLFDAIQQIKRLVYRSRMNPPYNGTAKDQIFFFFRCASVTFYTGNWRFWCTDLVDVFRWRQAPVILWSLLRRTSLPFHM